MEPQPELVRPYVAVLSGAADPPADPPEPPAWPAPAPARKEPSAARPEACDDEGREPERRRKRSRALTAGLTLGALAAVGVLVVVTTDGTASRQSGAQEAAPATLPSSAGPAARGTAAPSLTPTSSHATGVPTRPSGSAAAARKAADATPTSAADGTLRPGDRGPAVVRLQQLLFQQGFTYVAVTGFYDAATTRGVTQLQHDRGLTGDPVGVYGPQSRAALDPKS